MKAAPPMLETLTMWPTRDRLALLPVPGQTVCGASKAAVKPLTEGLHSELTETNVGVTVVFPGAIVTDISRNPGLNAPTAAEAKKSGVSKIKMTPPAEAARIIVDGLERDAYRVTVGKDATLMDRLCRLMPERAAGISYGQMRTLLAG